MDRGLVGYSLQGHTELDMTEATQQGMAEREREYSYQGVLGIRIVYALVQFIVCLKKNVEEFGVRKTFITSNWL